MGSVWCELNPIRSLVEVTEIIQLAVNIDLNVNIFKVGSIPLSMGSLVSEFKAATVIGMPCLID